MRLEIAFILIVLTLMAMDTAMWLSSRTTDMNAAMTTHRA